MLWLELGGDLRSDSGTFLIDGVEELEQVVEGQGSSLTMVDQWPEAMGCGDVVVMGDVDPISDGAERADAFIQELIHEPLRACE